jgi:hypothetical protein
LAMGGIAAYTFTATSGANYRVNATASGTGTDIVIVYRPDGTSYTTTYFYSSSRTRQIDITANQTGTWRIEFVNDDGSSPTWQESAGAFTFTLQTA